MMAARLTASAPSTSRRAVDVRRERRAANRFTQSSNVDERTMRELELDAFEIAIKGSGVADLMCGYNSINGSRPAAIGSC